MRISEMMGHRFIGIDEGHAQLLYADTSDPRFGWVLPLARASARDLQLIGDHKIMVGYDRGYIEVELSTGRVLVEVDRFSGVTSARRLSDGSTLLAGVNLDGKGGITIIRLDARASVMGVIRHDGDYVRIVRRTASQSYLLCRNDSIVEIGEKGDLLRKFAAEGFYHAWKAVRFPDGSTLVAAGYGAFMARFDSDGGLTSRFGDKQNMPEDTRPFFYASFQALEDGNVLVANWQGHGPGQGNLGKQLLEFGSDGRLIAAWSDPHKVSSLQGLLVLDGLDTAILHDESRGFVLPVE